MSLERTLSIIKPDATKRNITGKIINILETSGLQVIAQKRILMSKAEAEGFYAEHKERNFFADLIKFMISAPVIVQVLEGKDAVMRNRAVMGATDPKKAEKNTIRSDFGLDIEKNSVHGSDSKESAKREISYFFSELELLG